MKSEVNQFPSEIIFYGGTGQAKVVRPIIEYYGSKLVAVFDDTTNLKNPFPFQHGLLPWPPPPLGKQKGLPGAGARFRSTDRRTLGRPGCEGLEPFAG